MTDKITEVIRVVEPELKELVVNGSTYLTTLTRKYETRKKWTKPDEKKVISFIPGTVRQMLVKDGDHVNVSEKLLVLEAMKMMNTIYSPMEGVIKSVYVKIGDRIPKGTVLIEFI
jgi:biotin carboxyl carrier protein